MCTSISWNSNDHYFGRNLDIEHPYNESVTITPRNFPLFFRKERTLYNHFAFVGMAYVFHDYPLYYDGTNEAGLSIAGLNFPGNAFYTQNTAVDLDNIASFELIPWILGQCASIEDCLQLLTRINLMATPFHPSLPPTPLHWMICDASRSIVVEPLSCGLQIHENPIGVLTNNPHFDFHLLYLQQYMNLTKEPATNRFSKNLSLRPYSQGMGGIGLPGDFSSTSRFVRAAFVKENSLCNTLESACVNQFFHILDCVQQPKGSIRTENGNFEYTYYSSCCNTSKGIYYYKTYENSQLTAIHMHRENLESKHLSSFPLRKETILCSEN